MRRALVLLLALWLALPAVAVQPDEMLSDPALESRAREISRVLRCPVCQGETIDDSNAGIARDLRLYVRERLVAGDTDSEVVDNVTARYGDYVLFAPRASGANLVLWLAGPVLLLLGLLIAWRYARSRRGAGGQAAPVPLTTEEQARLRQIMEQD